jgi:hypothetical protein
MFPELRVTVHRRPLAVLAVALVCIGCAAPAAQVSGTPSDPAAATPSASGSATAAPTPSATAEASATAAPALAFEAPDDFLPPNSIVVAVVDNLQLRTGPGLAAGMQGLAMAGDRFSVSSLSGPVMRDGLDWYRLGPAIGGDLDAWAAAGSGDDRYLEVVPPECPAGNPDAATLISMNSWERLACFGDRSLTFEATLGCGACDGTFGGTWEPYWLATPRPMLFLWADFEAQVGPLEVRILPDFEFPALGSIVRVSGHFNDAASTTCEVTTYDGEQPIAVDQQTAELYCREHFVADSFEVIGTDPTYSDPYNP